MDKWLNISICEYNPPVILLGIALMLIFWYAAHCVNCIRKIRNARNILHSARKNFDGIKHYSENISVNLYRK